jgi:hypothetical protein
MRFALIALLLSATPALSSSDEAWTEFRAQVEAACRALATPDADIDVNPFGSESYGVALVTMDQDRAVCIYDKVAQTAELTAPF